MIRKRHPHERAGKAVSYVLVALGGVAALTIGLFSLAHPYAAWAPGEAHRADLPPVWGVSLLVVPIVLVGFAAFRTWWTLELDWEAWRARRRKRRRQV
jgi:hypothetical protein